MVDGGNQQNGGVGFNSSRICKLSIKVVGRFWFCFVSRNPSRKTRKALTSRSRSTNFHYGDFHLYHSQYVFWDDFRIISSFLRHRSLLCSNTSARDKAVKQRALWRTKKQQPQPRWKHISKPPLASDFHQKTTTFLSINFSSCFIVTPRNIKHTFP